MTNILTGLNVESNKNFDLDDPKQRQHYARYMTMKEKERFAKSYVRSLLEAKEEVLRFRRMARREPINPPCRLTPQERTSPGDRGMSVLGQTQT
jgi:hypothetical protein